MSLIKISQLCEMIHVLSVRTPVRPLAHQPANRRHIHDYLKHRCRIFPRKAHQLSKFTTLIFCEPVSDLNAPVKAGISQASYTSSWQRGNILEFFCREGSPIDNYLSMSPGEDAISSPGRASSVPKLTIAKFLFTLLNICVNFSTNKR
jgi:hypothetical protein